MRFKTYIGLAVGFVVLRSILVAHVLSGNHSRNDNPELFLELWALAAFCAVAGVASGVVSVIRAWWKTGRAPTAAQAAELARFQEVLHRREQAARNSQVSEDP